MYQFQPSIMYGLVFINQVANMCALGPEVKRESPPKRSRSPTAMEDAGREEKRLRIDDGPDAIPDIDELTRMIQLAQDASTSHIEVPTSDGASKDVEDSLGSMLLPELQACTQSPSATTLWSRPRHYTRQNHILPALGKAAFDIIRTLSEQPLEDTLNKCTRDDAETDVAVEYASLTSFFYTLRKFFSESEPLLDSDQLGIAEPQDREIVRIANLATTCASLFGSLELEWSDLHDGFLSVFVARDQNVPPDVSSLLLESKTQMFLAFLEGAQDATREKFLDDLFFNGLEDSLKRHHPTVSLSAFEVEFISNAKLRKDMLLNESSDPSNIGW